MDEETPVVFDCAGEQLVGIFHPGAADANVGVVIVVGGPQYRVGSHRQFVLIARQLAAAGIPVFRFDYRGMGDSTGEKRTFEAVGPDIRVAIDCLMNRLPNAKQVALMGLCDAASAIMMYGPSDRRVTGLILINPWVSTGAGAGKVRLRHYYLPRLVQKSFWRKVFVGEFAPIKSMGGILRSMRMPVSSQTRRSNVDGALDDQFIERMLSGLERFNQPILLLVSGKDIATHEFLDLCKADRRWRKVVQESHVATIELPDADHTMSARADLDAAVLQCRIWVDELTA